MLKTHYYNVFSAPREIGRRIPRSDAFHIQTNSTVRRIPHSDTFYNKAFVFASTVPVSIQVQFARGGIIASVQPLGKTSLGYR